MQQGLYRAFMQILGIDLQDRQASGKLQPGPLRR